MKKNTLLLVLLLFAFNSFAQEQFWKVYKNDLEKLEVTDTISLLYQSHHKMSRYQGNETIYKRSNYRGYNVNYTFNKSGNIELETSINEDSTIYLTIHYTYQNEKLTQTIQTYDSISFYKTTFKYDSNNKLIQETEFDENGSVSRIVYRKYNKEGNLIELLSDDKGSGQLYYKFTYKYIPDNNSIESICYDKKGKITYKRNYLLDEKLNLLEMTTTSNDSKMIVTYFYNQNGLLAKQESISERQNREFKDEINYEYVYNDAGQWIKKIEFYKKSVDGEIWMRTIK